MNIQWNPELLGLYQTTGSGKSSSSGSASSASFSSVLQNSVQAPSSLADIFKEASQKYDVPENLLLAVAKAESDFQPDVVSWAGASGIMQLMPETAQELGITDIFDPYQNIMGGAQELAGYLKTFDGDLKLSLASYNAGIGNVQKYGGVPPFSETQNYVVKVMDLMGQNLEAPNTVVGSSSSGNQSASSIDQLFGLTNADSEYTYADYQSFVKLFLAQMSMQIASLGQNDDALGRGGFSL